MQQLIVGFVAVVSLLTSPVSAEPPAYGSSADDFDINSISSYLDDDKPSGINKGMSYSYSNAFNSQPAAVLPDRFKAASTAPFTFGQKVIPSSPAYTPQVYNQPFSNVAQPPTLAEYAAAAASNYNANPSMMSGYGSYSTYNAAAPMVAHGTNAISYVTAPSKAIGTTHNNNVNNLPNYSASGTFHPQMESNSPAFQTSAVSNIGNPYDGSGTVSPFGNHNLPSAGRPPYPFIKPTPFGGHQQIYADNYRGSLGQFSGPFEGGYNSKPPRQLGGVYKGYYSGPTHIAAPPTGPSSHVGSPSSYKSPYYSEYKGGPGIHYSSRPHSAYSYKSPNSYESYDSTPYKYISESPRYPRYPSKYGGSRPSPYSGTKYSYSSRPLIYATGYKSYSNKPYSSPHHSYSGHF